MVKGVAVGFKSYEETIPKLLSLIKLNNELTKHNSIVIKTDFVDGKKGINVAVSEEVLKFCMNNKNPESEIFIAEGSNGFDTLDILEETGHKKLAERYGVGIVDLNKTETEEIGKEGFLGVERIMYPKILLNSFVISLALLNGDEEAKIKGSLYSMLGSYPAKYYKGLFSSRKNKLDKIPLKYQIHDIIKCKMPDLALLDASSIGKILAGQPIEVDKQGAKMIGVDWREISYIKLAEESFNNKDSKE